MIRQDKRGIVSGWITAGHILERIGVAVQDALPLGGFSMNYNESDERYGKTWVFCNNF